MSQFPRLKSFENNFELADPSAESTFQQSKLDWAEAGQHAHVVRLHRDLIRIRKQDPVFSRQDRSAVEGSVIKTEAFLLRFFGEQGDDRLILFNLGRDIEWRPVAEPLLASPPGRRWEILWSSEEPCYGGWGTPQFDGKAWPIPGHAAVVFRATPA